MENSIKIMGHLVIGYPDLLKSYQTAKTYIEKGIDILEIQIPFSNPTSDGKIITLANKIAIKNGVSWKDCLNFLNLLRINFPNQEIYLMTYLNKLFSLNFNQLFYQLYKLKITQLIIPDLPLDASEYIEYEKKFHIQLVPVIGPNITEEILNILLIKNPKFIYLMSGFKITGSSFNLNKKLQSIILKIKKKCSAKIGIGFGVNSHNDALEIVKIADVVIVGSSFIQAEQEGKLKEKIFEIQGK